jgi:hypothetical protein
VTRSDIVVPSGGLVAGNTVLVGDMPAAQVVAGLTLNAETIAGEILRGALARAYIDAKTTLDGLPIGTVLRQEIEQRIEADEAYAGLLELIGAKNGDATAWVMAASVVLAGSGHSLGSFIQYVESSLGDGTVSVTELKEAIDGAYGRWAMSVQALQGGLIKAIGGIEITVDGVTTTSAMNFIADYYRFCRLDGSEAVYLLSYDEANNRWTFGADIYAQRIVAQSIYVEHLTANSVTTPKIADNSVTNRIRASKSTTTAGTGNDVVEFTYTFTLTAAADVEVDGNVNFVDGGGNTPSYHQSAIKLTINGTEVAYNPQGGTAAMTQLSTWGGLTVPAGSCTVTMKVNTKGADFYDRQNFRVRWFYK